MVFQQQDHLHMAKVRYLNVNKRNTEFVNLESNSKNATGILRSKQKKYKPSGIHRIVKCAKGQLSSYKGFKWCFSETEVL